VIGAFARQPRYQGSGSSLINPSRLDNAFEQISAAAPGATYAPGYDLATDEVDEDLAAEAIAAAQQAEVVLLFAGLPDRYESEGFDREHLRLPENHIQLIQRVAAANPNTVVVLSNGAPVEMPWLGAVKAVLEGYLAGQAGAGGLADVLFGKVNPSGKLAETFPLQLQDVPASQNFPAGPKTVEYRESIYVGYRYFDTANQPVLFPFGHGLSYTSFAYSNLVVSNERIQEGDPLTVSLTVKNTGSVAGAEVVQLYVADMKTTIFRPAKELKRFAKVFLQPGEEKQVEFELDARCFAYYNAQISDWHIESGVFEILAGASSADIRARGAVWVESSRPEVSVPDLRQTAPVYYQLASHPLQVDAAAFTALYGRELPPSQPLPGEKFDVTTPLGDLRTNLIGRQFFNMMRNNMHKMFGGDNTETTQRMVERMVEEMPLRSLILFSNGAFSPAMVDSLLQMMNGQLAKGLVGLVKTFFKKK
jgi:beta-glucosidase